MKNFSVSPQSCLVFKALIETKSLREAAASLDQDPAQLTRTLQKISQETGYVQKVGNKWSVTEEGKRLVRWVEESMARQNELLEEKATINLTAFPWLAEEMLIPNLQKLMDISKSKNSFRIGITAGDLEEELISGRTDYVITCHPPNDPLIAHKVFSPDPWFIVVPGSWTKKFRGLSQDQTRELLLKSPFVRLTSVNPEKMLGFSPETFSDLMVDGVVGARAAVSSGLGWSCLPSFALKSSLKRGDIVPVNLKSFTEGQLSVWWPRTRKDNLSTVRTISKWLGLISEE